MAVQLTGTGGYFTRQGMFIGEYNRVTEFYGSTLDAAFLEIWAQYASSEQPAVEDLPAAVDAFKNTDTSYLSVLVADGQTQSLLQVTRDTSVVPQTFQRSVQVLIAQMKSNSQSVNRPTIGGTVTPGGSNLGDTTVVTSLTNRYGDPLDMTFAETVTGTVGGNGASYATVINFVGENALPSSSPDWPGGSGASQSVTILDQTQTGIVTDGSFESWAGTGNNDPSNWDIIDGAIGVTVQRGVTDPLRGSFYAELVSDGAQATQLGQAVSLSVNTVYAVCCYAKISATTATGEFIISLTDADGNILDNDLGTALSETWDVNGEVDTNWAIFTAFFSTPRQLPSVVNIQVGYSTAATSGRILSLDLVGIVQATQLYVGGPFVAAFGGTTISAPNDTYSIVYTNSLDSDSFVRGADRLFGFRNLDVYYPSSVSPTIPDSLVTN